MTKYQVWIGGESPWSRSYTGEVGGVRLTDEQIARWVPDYGKADPEDIHVDAEAWMERISSFDDSDDPTDLPGYNEVTGDCFGYGAYTDQTFGVATEDDEVLHSWDFSDLWRDVDTEPDHPDPVITLDNSEDHMEGVWILYNSYSKGGWGTTIELPDDEEFDASKLKFEIKSVDGFNDVCTSFSYDGVDHFDDSDTDGKGVDYFLVVDGCFKTLF